MAGAPEVDGIRGGERDGDEDEEDTLSEEAIVRRAFPILCNFWRLVHEVRWIYYPVAESPPAPLRERLVEYGYRELIAWAETLPSFFLRREQCPHFVIVFHIEADTPPPRTPSSGTTGSSTSPTPMLRCTDPEWHVYLHLCIYGYERLGRTFRISEIVAQGLLTMTMRDTDMTGREAYKIMETMQERGLIHVQPNLEDKIRATFMIDLNLALTNPEAARAENMANDFSDLATFQDLVDLDPVGR
ncbi:hypothetical protein NPX13_g9757 [Xylaria arbuscula]|uniref:Uncharacterized protein n=1 Tax=Xylaria arbuscula TaxID=114810 RepID=A0A9W8N636_9PEZI|nr:hypothetical protein NPX13_g9757 [Xylaria arbuscula]